MPKAPILQGPRVKLFPLGQLNRMQLNMACLWRRDPEVTRYISTTLLLRLDEMWVFDFFLTSVAEIIWAIFDENEGHIGFTELQNINLIDKSATTLIVIGDKTAWGKGYATEVMALRAEYAFKQLGLCRLQSSVNPENIASKRALEKAGYRLVNADTTFHYELRAEDYLSKSNKGP